MTENRKQNVNKTDVNPMREGVYHMTAATEDWHQQQRARRDTGPRTEETHLKILGSCARTRSRDGRGGNGWRTNTKNKTNAHRTADGEPTRRRSSGRAPNDETIWQHLPPRTGKSRAERRFLTPP